MGVTGLWRLIDASGKPVPLETLEGKILAIDISIWIYQVLQGYQDRRGHAVPNAHLLGLYNRICKLLYFRIKPVFVFDGGVPLLKKNTIAARKKHKAQIAGTAEKMKNDLLHNLMKHSLVKGVLAKKIGEKVQSSIETLNGNAKQVDDIFKLPEMSSDLTEDHSSDDSDTSANDLSPRKQAKWKGNIHTVDVNTNDFKSLPADVRYDILTDLKETRKQNSWGRLNEMPEDSHQFSGYQMKRLLKRRQVQESLEVAEREMGGKTLTLEELDQLMTGQGVDTKRNDKVFRIASNSMTRMIYINDPKNLKSSQEVSDSTSIDSSQPGCSSDGKVSGELSSILEEPTSLVNNINEYDLDDEWDSDLEIVNEVVGSPAVRKYFGKASNPVLAYMQAQSGLSQEKIFEFIQQNKVVLSSTDKSEKKNKLKRKKLIRDNKKILSHRKKARTDSETSLDAVEEMVKIKEEINSDSADESDQFEMVEEKPSTPPPQEQSVNLMSSSSDSDDFIEVNDVPIPHIVEKKQIEITVKADNALNDDEDIFADVFKSEPAEFNSFNSSSDLSIEHQTTEFLTDLKCKTEKLNSSSECAKIDTVLKYKTLDNSKLEEINSSIEKTTDRKPIKTTKNDISVNNKVTSNFEKKDVIVKESSIKLVDAELLLSAQALSHKNKNGNILEPVAETSVDIPISLKNFPNTLITPEKKISNSILEHVQIKDSINEKNSENNVELVETSLVKSIDEERPLPEIISNNYEEIKIVPELTKKMLKIPSTDHLITPENIPSISNTPEKQIAGKKSSERVEQIITRLKNDGAELLAKANREDDLLDIRSQLESENQELVENIGKLERQATEITAQMRSDAQDLLRLFGIPYVVAPQEAEAQCAYLELLNLTDGTVTDDSDIWLFGGRCVYKNFFNNDKRVMQYLIKDIEHHFKLTRQSMIQLALLVGSDYTLGIPGVGSVTALEVLAHFPSEGDDILRGLINFATWLRAGKLTASGKTTLRNKLKNISVDAGFPSQSVAQAYLFPTVDESTEPFSWSKPNIVLLADYTREKFGWSKLKFDEVMGPVMKKFLDHKSQRNLLNYFKFNTVPRPIEQNLSKRVQKAVQMMGNEGGENENLDNDDEPNKEVVKKGKRKQRKTSTNKTETSETVELEKKIPEDDTQEEKLSGKTKKATSTEKKEEYIPQREKDKSEALKKKLQAIEVFKKSTKAQKRSGKKPVRRTRNAVTKEAQLSESSSDSN